LSSSPFSPPPPKPKPTPEPEPEQYDWSRLSVKELETFEALLLKLNGEAVDMVIDVTPSRKPEPSKEDKPTEFRRRKYSEPEQEAVIDEDEPADSEPVKRKRSKHWPLGLKPGHAYMPN